MMLANGCDKTIQFLKPSLSKVTQTQHETLEEENPDFKIPCEKETKIYEEPKEQFRGWIDELRMSDPPRLYSLNDDFYKCTNLWRQIPNLEYDDTFK